MYRGSFVGTGVRDADSLGIYKDGSLGSIATRILDGPGFARGAWAGEPPMNSPTNAPSGGPSGAAPAASGGVELGTLGGGCFWCTEAVFADLRGVASVVPGYSGGKVLNPSYEQVCEGNTGHAEVVQVTFDPTILSYHDLLSIFFTVHDPTTLNRQGNDVGTQYRSVIFVRDATQESTARQVIAEVQSAAIWKGHVVTEVAPFSVFYPAEEYHRNYFRLHPDRAYCQVIIAPKVAKFRKHFSDRLKVPGSWEQRPSRPASSSRSRRPPPSWDADSWPPFARRPPKKYVVETKPSRAPVFPGKPRTEPRDRRPGIPG